ncbi:MAG: hypothetical protein J0H17_06935 [Rhizobiales bacterium]|nr:hypothetical protein [Hyphomicrobiales bacterium]
MMRFIDRADEAIAGLMLFACLAIVCVEVISRSYLGMAISWSEELSRYLIIVSTYFARLPRCAAATTSGSSC